MKEKIAILGGGNLGASIAQGLLKDQSIPAQNITVTRRKLQLIEHLAEQGINTISNNPQAVEAADLVIIAVKPKQAAEIFEEIKGSLVAGRHLVISVVTGFTINSITDIIGTDHTVFRVMPNTAIALQQSMSCISSYQAQKEQKDLVEGLLLRLGKIAWVDEELMDASTVLGACGIAFALRFIRAAMQGGIEIGFDSKTAELIAAQTVKGAASLVLERKRHPEREIDLVTTPQGCTIAGLNEMEHQGFSSALIKGVVTSFSKIDPQ